MKFRHRQWMFAAVAAAAIAAAAGTASADVRAGIEMWRAGNYEGAVREWRPLAERGDADAQFNLGQAFKLGRGVPLDLRQAQNWYERAARQGHAQAEANLGLLLFQNNEQQRAMPWIRRAAERGDPRALYVLGTAHFNGDVVERDWPRAYALMHRAAGQGLPQARSSLTEMERHLSAEDRARGTALAQQMGSGAPVAVATASPPAAPVPVHAGPAHPPRVSGAQPSIVRTPVPPSTPPRAEPPRGEAPRVEPRRTAPVPAPVRHAVTGRWRVQLGAFSNEANARRQWGAVRRVPAVGALDHSIVRAGSIYRLQAGPLGDRGDANRVCAAARQRGHDCIVVAP